MRSNWPIRALSEVANEITVGFVGTMADQYQPVGIPFLRSLNVRPFGIHLNDVRYISNDFHANLKKSTLRPGDVVIVRTGKPGTCAVIPPDLPEANCSDVVIVRCSHQLRPHFLCYWVNAMAGSHVSAHTVGAVQQHFNVSAAKLLRLPVPSLAVQDQVLSTLRAIDELIEQLSDLNATLEAIAQAIFKSWFIDFDPVKAKSEGRVPDGIDEATAALFPDSFEESALGAIPKGWTIDDVGNAADCVGGGTPSTKEEAYWEPGTHHWVTPKDLSGLGSPVLLDTERKLSSLGIQKVSSGLLPKGTLLLSSRAPIGYLALAQIPLAINQGFIAMKPGGRLPPEYLYFWTASAMDEIKQKANGSTFMEISKSAFRPIKLVVPEARIVQAFRDIVGTIFEAIEANELERRTLTKIRDTLLPRLISGKLKLPELQEVAEAL